MAKKKQPSPIIDFAADMQTHEPAIDLTDFRKDRAPAGPAPSIQTVLSPLNLCPSATP